MLGGADAVRNARRYTRNRDDYCLAEVQKWMKAPWSGPWAMDAWHRWGGHHAGDWNPPAGVPVYWSSPRHKYGHIALSVGGGRVRSTDWPRDTHVGETTIREMTRRWGIHYVGWADRFSGGAIPNIGSTHHNPPHRGGHFTTGQVYQHVCHEGVRDSDSVRNVQQRLIDLGFAIPAGPTGNWPRNGQTTHAVRAWQRKFDNDAPAQWKSGRKLGFKQAQLLFRGTGMRIVP